MKVLHTALRSLTLHSSVTHNVGASTNAGTNVGVTVADARVSAEEVERGFVSDGSKTYLQYLDLGLDSAAWSFSAYTPEEKSLK